jgi:hypothetical protein
MFKWRLTARKPQSCVFFSFDSHNKVMQVRQRGFHCFFNTFQVQSDKGSTQATDPGIVERRNLNWSQVSRPIPFPIPHPKGARKADITGSRGRMYELGSLDDGGHTPGSTHLPGWLRTLEERRDSANVSKHQQLFLPFLGVEKRECSPRAHSDLPVLT